MDPAVLEAISSPRKREILRLVWREEQAAGAIHEAMPDVTFGAISLQLKWLLERGLVDVRFEQRNRFYKAKREVFGAAGAILEQMWDDALGRLKVAAELEEARRGPRPDRRKKKKK